MVEELLLIEGPDADLICISQFDKLFTKEFKQVTIPKVRKECFLPNIHPFSYYKHIACISYYHKHIAISQLVCVN